MAFDQGLAERIRESLVNIKHVEERKMFGGLAFMVNGNMFVGIVGDTLMARIGPVAYESALRRAHVRVMNFTGKAMKGYVFVDPPGFEKDSDLNAWINTCLSFVNSLPAK